MRAREISAGPQGGSRRRRRLVTAPAGWHADPTSRFVLRWWDGAHWTSYVSDGSNVTTDALEPEGGAGALTHPVLRHIAVELIADSKIFEHTDFGTERTGRTVPWREFQPWVLSVLSEVERRLGDGEQVLGVYCAEGARNVRLYTDRRVFVADGTSPAVTEAFDERSRRLNPAFRKVLERPPKPDWLPDADWFVDPLRKHPGRFWDGREWTRHVVIRDRRYRTTVFTVAWGRAVPGGTEPPRPEDALGI